MEATTWIVLGGLAFTVAVGFAGFAVWVGRTESKLQERSERHNECRAEMLVAVHSIYAKLDSQSESLNKIKGALGINSAK